MKPDMTTRPSASLALQGGAQRGKINAAPKTPPHYGEEAPAGRPERLTKPSMQFDPIMLEIIWSRLGSIVDEAATGFVRTSFSSLVREANDYAVVLTDADGNSLTQSSFSIPSFISTLPRTVQHVIRMFPKETLYPGDVIITNDPWLATGHIHDVSTVAPIFLDGKLVAFSAVTSHAGHRRPGPFERRAVHIRGRPADPRAQAGRERQAPGRRRGFHQNECPGSGCDDGGYLGARRGARTDSPSPHRVAD